MNFSTFHSIFIMIYLSYLLFLFSKNGIELGCSSKVRFYQRRYVSVERLLVIPSFKKVGGGKSFQSIDISFS